MLVLFLCSPPYILSLNVKLAAYWLGREHLLKLKHRIHDNEHFLNIFICSRYEMDVISCSLFLFQSTTEILYTIPTFTFTHTYPHSPQYLPPTDFPPLKLKPFTHEMHMWNNIVVICWKEELKPKMWVGVYNVK